MKYLSPHIFFGAHIISRLEICSLSRRRGPRVSIKVMSQQYFRIMLYFIITKFINYRMINVHNECSDETLPKVRESLKIRGAVLSGTVTRIFKVGTRSSPNLEVLTIQRWRAKLLLW